MKRKEKEQYEVYTNELSQMASSSRNVGPLITTNDNGEIIAYNSVKQFESFSKAWDPESDKKKHITDIIPEDSLNEQDYLIRGYSVEKGFEMQIKTLVSNALNFLHIKYANILHDNTQLNIVIESVSRYLKDTSYSINLNNLMYNINNLFNPNTILLQLGCGNNTYAPDIEVETIFKQPFKIVSYITLDITVVQNFTTMISSFVYNEINKNMCDVFKSILIFDKESEDLGILSSTLQETIDWYMSEVQSILYKIFSKAFAMAQQYNEYIQYKAFK